MIKRKAYIYLIENKKTGQLYVGQSVRFKGYFCSSKKINEQLVSGEFTKDDFDRKILIQGEFTKEQLDELENMYIEEYDTYENPFHYNLTKGGNHWGFMTQERKKSHSETMKANYENGLEPWNKGMDLSMVTGNKITKSKMGKNLSDDHKKTLSESQLKYWSTQETKPKQEVNTDHSRYGATLTDESKKKISESRLTSEKTPRGSKHFRSTPVIIEGVKYETVTEASRALNIPQPTITYRCRSKNFTDYNYETK